ncbi:MAG TPA: response regulator, partial [Polyangiaceae bacterium LLY-WYZ-15_(1-7)]|nr:response regulator [Polyangiaceae bacterium LLY-WYZ-15_(1-7)]
MNPRILLVDDDALFAESVRLFLESDPLSVVVAHDVAGAKAVLSEKAVSLLVTDDRLPDGRGLELTDPALIDEAPVIVVTAHPNFEHAVEAVRRGAVDYLTKPVELAELRHAIHRSLGRDRMRRLVEARRRAEARQPPRADGAIASLLATV